MTTTPASMLAGDTGAESRALIAMLLRKSRYFNEFRVPIRNLP
jgi:hypothetical protein